MKFFALESDFLFLSTTTILLNDGDYWVTKTVMELLMHEDKQQQFIFKSHTISRK